MGPWYGQGLIAWGSTDVTWGALIGMRGGWVNQVKKSAANSLVIYCRSRERCAHSTGPLFPRGNLKRAGPSGGSRAREPGSSGAQALVLLSSH